VRDLDDEDDDISMSEEEEYDLENQETRDKNIKVEEEKDNDIEYADMPSLSELKDKKTFYQAARNGDDENVLDVSATEETVVMMNRSAEHGYNLRPNHTRDYSHRFTLLSIASSVKK
jgi:hypothetical protein